MKFMKVVNKIFFVIKILIIFFYFGGSYALAETVEETGVFLRDEVKILSLASSSGIGM